ncbi:MAG: ABC transporter ATP-binding protein [Mobilitalea sp.]
MANLKIEPMKHPDKIINYWKKEKYVVICILLFGLSFNIAMVFGPIYQGKLIDSMIGTRDLNYVIKMSVTFILLILVIQVLRYFKRFYIRRFANSTSATMRLMIYNNIMHRTAPDLKTENTGDLMTRAVSDVELCVEGMRKFTTEVFDTGVLMAAYLLTMLVYDIKITLLSICFIPVAMFLADRLKSFIYKYTRNYRKKSSEVTDITYDMIENAMLYRISGVDADNRKRYESNLSDLQNKAIKANILENSMQPIYNVIAMIGIILVIYLGGTKVVSGEWTIGEFTTYFYIFIAMASKASKASKLFNSVQKSRISWERIKSYLTEYQSKDTSINLQEDNSKLVVENLNFSYTADNNMIIRDINFHAHQGEIIGITGPIACGKSTIALALTGLYPYLGSIQVDGKELKDYSEYERSRMISILGHNAELLSDTIYNNVTMGNEQDITEVLRDVCFETDLVAMPEGKDTLVGNGGLRLSGGQQARISLARALINKNKIIILDDPFSAVDMKTEREIINNIKKNYKGSIMILVSHRLAIFPEIDQILLMHSDKTVEYGSHIDLMEKSSLYAEIYRLQYAEGGVNYEK